MSYYEDDAVVLDPEGITIRSYWYPGNKRTIAYSSIRDISSIELGALTGRHRLVGLGFRRPRHFFHWDRRRSSKNQAISLDVGGFIQVVVTPDDHEAVLAIIDEHRSKAPSS